MSCWTIELSLQGFIGEIMKNEFGGCLPKEAFIRNEAEKVNDLWHYSLKMNSGRSAIYVAALHSHCTVVYLPRYTCPTVREFLLERQISVKEYGLTCEFLPDVLEIESNALLVWVNYVGCMRNSTVQAVCRRYGAQLLLDHCQAFFDEPVPGIYNVYSLRKFIGVPCGSLLFHSQFCDTLPHFMDELPYSSAADEFLEIAACSGSNAAYPAYCRNEESLRHSLGRMPESVAHIIPLLDLTTIQNKRRENFLALHDKLGAVNIFCAEFSGNSSFMYPLLIERDGLREVLIDRHIYCPTWWRRVLSLPEATGFERFLTKNLIPLPVDQRYSISDMSDMADIILEELENDDHDQ